MGLMSNFAHPPMRLGRSCVMIPPRGPRQSPQADVKLRTSADAAVIFDITADANVNAHAHIKSFSRLNEYNFPECTGVEELLALV